MNLRYIINLILFPSIYSRKYLQKIHQAPEPEQRHIYSLFDYHSKKGKSLIYAIKSKRDYIRDVLVAKELAYLIQDFLSEQSMYAYFLHPIIINIPLHKTQKIKRGFNQTDIIARVFAKDIQGQYRKNILIKNRATRKQALLSSKKERQDNVRGCFTVRDTNYRDIYQKDIIIIDDLITTGSTINECRNLLLRHGARNVIAITIAH